MAQPSLRVPGNIGAGGPARSTPFCYLEFKVVIGLAGSGWGSHPGSRKKKGDDPALRRTVAPSPLGQSRLRYFKLAIRFSLRRVYSAFSSPSAFVASSSACLAAVIAPSLSPAFFRISPLR